MSFDSYTSDGAESMDQVIFRARSFLMDLLKLSAESGSDIDMKDILDEAINHNDLLLPSKSELPLSINPSANLRSTESLTHMPLSIDTGISSVTSLLGFSSDFSLHKDPTQSSDTNVASSSQSKTMQWSVSHSSDTSCRSDLDLTNILVVSHGLLLKELTRLILQHYVGKLDGHLIRETSRICHNTGVSKYLMQVSVSGQTDTHLSDLGKKQAKLVGLRLRDVKFSHMFSSDLYRAAETARAIAEANTASSCELILDSRLRERSFGSLEGKTLQDFKSAIYKSGMSFDSYTSDGAESMDQVIFRARSFLMDLLKLSAESGSDIDMKDILDETINHNDLLLPSKSELPISINPSANLRSTESLTHMPLSIDTSISSVTSLLGFSSDFSLHKDPTQSSDTNVASSSQSKTMQWSVSHSSDTSCRSDLDLTNILVVSHGLLLKELTRLILQHYVGKLDGYLIRETSRICHNTGISKYLMQCGISNAMDGTEDDAIYEDDDEDNSTSDDSADTDSENDIYADDVTDEQFYQLFGHSDDEYSDFEGFE
ncbi:hypothetical protein Btru_067152 [Bulinus truncatus]|nr:hypothetical protein Btru_067152 [Bulinus truncatus]